MMEKGKLAKQLLVLGTVVVSCVATLNVPALAAKFPTEYVNHKQVVTGKTLHVAYPVDSSFKGVFMSELSTDYVTNDMSTFGNVQLFMHDKNGKYVKGGLADVTFDLKNKTANITINKKTRWSDGQPVTARDMAFAYEIVANKDSTSAYYSDALEDIVGMKEYHEGKADHVTGLEEKDDKHLVIHYQNMVPAMEYQGSEYLLTDAQPYHYLKDVSFAKMAQSDQVRKHPLFYGPYKLDKVVQGESLKWSANKYYGGPKPKIKHVTVETVPVTQVVQAMRAKKYDVFLNEPHVAYSKTRDLKDYKTLGVLAYGFEYLGFKVGKADKEGNSVLDKKYVMNNRNLRLAMAYAMNVSQVAKKYGKGLQVRANSMVSPAYGAYHDKKLKPYPESLAKANKLLDEAGFKRGKDGYRTRPDGKKLTLHFLTASSGKGNKAINENYMQRWKKIGLRVKLVGGRPQEFNTYEDKLQNNDSDFDLWLGDWGLTAEPSVAATAAYSSNSAFNHGHFVTKENTALLKSLNSPRAFDTKYRVAQMHKWQAYMQKEAYVLPVMYEYDLSAVAKNVTGFTVTGANMVSQWDNLAFTK